jgi:hypothetical protein
MSPTVTMVFPSVTMVFPNVNIVIFVTLKHPLYYHYIISYHVVISSFFPTSAPLLPLCSTLDILTEQFHWGLSMCEDILFKLHPGKVTPWERLFVPIPFFSLFKNYLQVGERYP